MISFLPINDDRGQHHRALRIEPAGVTCTLQLPQAAQDLVKALANASRQQIMLLFAQRAAERVGIAHIPGDLQNYLKFRC